MNVRLFSGNDLKLIRRALVNLKMEDNLARSPKDHCRRLIKRIDKDFKEAEKDPDLMIPDLRKEQIFHYDGGIPK